MSVSHRIAHKKLGIAGNFSGKAIATVSNSIELENAISRFGDRRTLAIEETSNVILTTGSPVVSGIGTDWRQVGVTTLYGHLRRVDDLIRFRGENRFYKIKSIDSDTQITLWENYLGASAATSMTVGFYYIDWVSIILMPSQDYHHDAVPVFPGQAFIGASRFGVRVSEGATTTVPYPFSNWGENRLAFVEIGASRAWSSLDSCFQPGYAGTTINNFYKWAGQESIVDNCTLDMRNLGGSHGGGFVGCLPYVAGGRSKIRNSIIKADNITNFADGIGHDITATNANTRVEMDNVTIELSRTIEGLAPFFPDHLDVNKLGTFELNNLKLKMPHTDLALTNVYNNLLGGIQIGQASKVRISDLKANYENSSASDTVGVSVAAAATVDIDHSNIEVGGTNNTALYVNHASAVVNVRGSRLASKSASDNAINCVAGTVNLDAASTAGRIGATIGAGTVNINTAT